jgi:hypothetical protein
MWSSLGLIAALTATAAEAPALELVDVRNTYGMLGPTRSGNEYLPGDTVVLAFDVAGARVNPAGKVLYSIAMEVDDPSGKAKFRQAPRDLEAAPGAGAKRFPAAAKLQVGLDQPPGDYTLKVIVADRSTGAKGSLTRSYRILPRAFGIVGLTTSGDPDGRVSVPRPTKGQMLWVTFYAVNWERDPSTKQPRTAVSLAAFGRDGQPALGTPMSGEISQNVPDRAVAIPMQFGLNLTEAGEFNVRLRAEDRVTGNRAEVSFPLVVAPAR